jgi:hypothetical protein
MTDIPEHPSPIVPPVPDPRTELPEHVRSQVHRVLAAEARRLLREQVDRDALAARTAAGPHLDPLDRGPDQGPPPLEAEPRPVDVGVQLKRRRGRRA